MSRRTISGVSSRKPMMYPAMVRTPGQFPQQQHLPIFRDLVLPLLRRREIRRVDVLQPDEDAPHSGAPSLLDEPRNPVTHGVNLDDESGRDVFVTKLDKSVENGLPFPVAGKIVVGGQEAVGSLSPILADNALHVVSRSGSGLAPLDIDDRAEGALEGAPSACIEAYDPSHCPSQKLPRCFVPAFAGAG
jgi:hypothetical protein